MIRAIRELGLINYWRYVLAEPRIFKSGLVHGRIYKVSEETGEITEEGKYQKAPTKAMAYDVGCELNQIIERAKPTVSLAALPVWVNLLLAVLLICAVSACAVLLAILSN